MVTELSFNYSLYTFSCRQIVGLWWSFLPEVYAQSCSTSSLTEGIDVLWFTIKLWHEGTQADFWGACRQVDLLTVGETTARTPMAHLYVVDTPAKTALSKDLVGGGHLSRGEVRGPCGMLSLLLLQLRTGSGSGGYRQRGLLAAGRCAWQGGAAAEAGVAVTAKSCACGRAVHYTVIWQPSITQCFLSLKWLWTWFCTWSSSPLSKNAKAFLIKMLKGF